MICPVCGYNASADSRFCSQCGTPLSSETQHQQASLDLNLGTDEPDLGHVNPEETSSLPPIDIHAAHAIIEASPEEENEPEQLSEKPDSLNTQSNSVDSQWSAPEQSSEESENSDSSSEISEDSHNDEQSLDESEVEHEKFEDDDMQVEPENEEEGADQEDIQEEDPHQEDELLDFFDFEDELEEPKPRHAKDKTMSLPSIKEDKTYNGDTLRMNIPGDSFSKFSGRLKKIDSILEGDPSSQNKGQDQSVDAEGPTIVFRAIPPVASTGVMPSIKGDEPTRFSTSDRDKKNSGIPRKALIGLIVAAVAILLLVFLGVRSCNSGTEIPYVVGMQTQEARTRLESAGFNVEVKTEVVEDSFGEVLKCSPESGSRRREGSTVTLTVSASLTVPEVVGVDLDTARKALEDEGAKNIVIKAEASNQPENTVIAVSPKEGEGFEPESEVTLTVATSATVPDVVGLNADEAISQLEEIGYETDVEWTESEKSALSVLSTKPEAGTLANLGSTVELSVVAPGPSSFLKIQEYKEASSEDDSAYLDWKGFTMAGSYVNPETGYVSQLWKADDGTTVSFGPAPYMEDNQLLDTTDHMAEGYDFLSVRLYIPNTSSNSQGEEVSMSTVKKYMDACDLDNLTDSCNEEDIEYNGQTSSELGLGNFVCAEGTTNSGLVWTILITEDGVAIGLGEYECYSGMYPICDSVAANEILTAQG